MTTLDYFLREHTAFSWIENGVDNPADTLIYSYRDGNLVPYDFGDLYIEADDCYFEDGYTPEEVVIRGVRYYKFPTNPSWHYSLNSLPTSKDTDLEGIPGQTYHKSTIMQMVYLKVCQFLSEEYGDLDDFPATFTTANYDKLIDFLRETDIDDVFVDMSFDSDNNPVVSLTYDNRIVDAYGDNKILVDNFDFVKTHLDFKNPGDFYYIEIILRKKDNPQGDFNYCKYLKYYWIFSLSDLDHVEPYIKKLCEDMNARAYIYLNPRSAQAVTAYAQVLLKKQLPPKYAGSEIQLASGKSEDWDSRPLCFFDVDTEDKAIVADVKAQLASLNCPILHEYISASGGTHIIVADKIKAKQVDLKKYDNGKDLGRHATVSLEIDKASLLYANLK